MSGGGTQPQDREEIESLRRALAEAQDRVRIFEQHCQVLQAERQTMERRYGTLEAERQVMEQRVQELEHQLKLLKRCLFGSRSEKVSADELEARIAEHAQEAALAVAQAKRPDQPPAEAEEEKPEHKEEGNKSRKKARPHGRSPLPDHLPRVRV